MSATRAAPLMRLRRFLLLSLWVTADPVSAGQTDRPAPPDTAIAQDLKRLSLEQLAELDVTSVSRRVERLAQTAAAISVIRQDDIRRSGVATLPEALRLADGVDVARSDGRTWNITARGFNIVTTNKLLVLMDGRTLYSPLFSGTFWDVQDPALADVDRIEVIRGPGGSVWGANAVNGVINIISKPASQTAGTHVLVAAGTENQLITTVRHGARTGLGDGNYRIFGKYRKQGANVLANGADAEDALQLGQFGIRFDSNEQRAQRWTLQGNVYRGSEELRNRDAIDVTGGYAQGKWVRSVSARSEIQVATYYDYTYRKVPLQFRESRHTAEVDVQHRFAVRDRHDLVYGGQLRVTTSRDTGVTFSLDPERRTNDISGVFVQDEIALRPGSLFLTIGTKLERNDYTGLEVQPTGRLRWSPGARQTVWGAVSRAVRLPTRFDNDLRIPAGQFSPELRGSDDFESESVIAYEAGYRVLPHPRISIDLATYANDYDNIRSQEFPSRLGPVIELRNTLNAFTAGFESGGTVQILDRWRVHASYAYLHKDFTRDPGSQDISGGRSEGDDPASQFTVRSYLDLQHGLALDSFFRHVAARPAPAVPAYSSLDVRLGWAARPGWELSIVGQNLLDDSHPELGPVRPDRPEFQRGVHVRSIWQF